MLVGAGALGATDEVIAVADKLGAGCAKALLGKAALPDDLPWVTGSLGLLGTKPSWDLLKGCDTFLMVGSCFPYSEFLPEPGKARGVQIDINGSNLSLRYPMEVNLVGDAAATLAALLPLLTQNTDTAWREKIAADMSRLVEGAGSARHGQRRAAESTAGVLGAVAAPARQRHRHRGLRLRRQLVRPRPEDAARA